MNSRTCGIFRTQAADIWAVRDFRLVRRDAERRYRATGNTTVKMVPPDAGSSM